MSNKLSEIQKNILYKEHTEKPFSSLLCDEKRKGTYVCAGCNSPLFTSDQKFESGTGWPSFFDSLPDSFETKSDRSFLWSELSITVRNVVAIMDMFLTMVHHLLVKDSVIMEKF